MTPLQLRYYAAAGVFGMVLALLIHTDPMGQIVAGGL